MQPTLTWQSLPQLTVHDLPHVVDQLPVPQRLTIHLVLDEMCNHGFQGDEAQGVLGGLGVADGFVEGGQALCLLALERCGHQPAEVVKGDLVLAHAPVTGPSCHTPAH